MMNFNLERTGKYVLLGLLLGIFICESYTEYDQRIDAWMDQFESLQRDRAYDIFVDASHINHGLFIINETYDIGLTGSRKNADGNYIYDIVKPGMRIVKEADSDVLYVHDSEIVHKFIYDFEYIEGLRKKYLQRREKMLKRQGGRPVPDK